MNHLVEATAGVDPQSEAFLNLLAEQERVRANRVAGVRTVLVILSARGMVYDRESLRQKILLTYPDAAVFFRTTLGKAVGVEAPVKVDLLIDFTGPGQRQRFFFAKKLRRMARVAVGRNSGLFRKKIYDRIFDEKSAEHARRLPKDLLAREREVQREVLHLAGVALSQQGDVLPDRGRTIALALPGLAID